MDVSTILERIERDARLAAEATVEQAKERAQAVEARSRETILHAREEALRQARLSSEDQQKRMRSMANLDERKEDLKAKRLLLDEAFSLALEKMNRMPAEKARAYALRVLLTVASGDETVIASDQSPWCDDLFIKDANEALQAASRPAGLALSKERRALASGGFILSKDGAEVNCTYQTTLAMKRLDLESEVAALLYA